MATRRHSNDYNLSALGPVPHTEAGEPNDIWWVQNRIHNNESFGESELDSFNHDRRGSAPDYLTGDQRFLDEHLVFPANHVSSPNLDSDNISPQDLPPQAHRDALSSPNRRSSFRVDPWQGRRSSTTHIRDDSELSVSRLIAMGPNLPPSPNLLLGQKLRQDPSYTPTSSTGGESPSRYVKEDPGSLSKSVPPIMPMEPSSIYNPEIDKELLSTCRLQGPGCFVLIPPGGQTTDEQKSEEKLRSEKKNMNSKKSSRKPTDEIERQAIKLKRKQGVCIRCKIFKEKCRGGIPCDRCRSLRQWKSICAPAQFAEKGVFNREIYRDRVLTLLENIQNWEDDDDDSFVTLPEYFRVHNGYHPTLELRGHKFIPHDETMLQHIVWRITGSPTFSRYPSTCYGLKSDVDPQTLDTYLDKHVACAIQRDIPSVTCPVYGVTMKAAYDYALSNKNLSILVQKALRIWIAQTFFFHNAWRMSGPNTLGMEAIDEPGSNTHGWTPLPRLVNQQLDAAIELRVATMEKELLTDLQVHVQDRNSSDWFGIFLTIFVHLTSLERDMWSLTTWEHDSTSLEERVRLLAVSESGDPPVKAFTWPLQDAPTVLMAKNEYLAEILVSHFRTVSKSYIPFTLDWDQEQVVRMAGNEKEAVEYMKTMSAQMSTLEPHLLSRQAAEYDRTNSESFNGIFTSRLMLGEDRDSL